MARPSRPSLYTQIHVPGRGISRIDPRPVSLRRTKPGEIAPSFAGWPGHWAIWRASWMIWSRCCWTGCHGSPVRSVATDGRRCKCCCCCCYHCFRRRCWTHPSVDDAPCCPSSHDCSIALLAPCSRAATREAY